MKKFLCFIAFLVLLPAFSYPKNKRVVQCRRQTVPFVVDGKTGDWNMGSLSFDRKTGFAYAFTNDGKFLYIQLKMLDMAVQRKALLTGLTVWIDPGGKGKHVFGIVYPHGRKHGPSPGGSGHPGQRTVFRQHRNNGNHRLTPEQVQMFNRFFAHENPQFKGFEKHGLSGGPDIRARLQIDTLGHVVYEAEIPLKAVFKTPAGYLTKAKPFSITIETGYLQMDMSRMQGGG